MELTVICDICKKHSPEQTFKGNVQLPEGWGNYVTRPDNPIVLCDTCNEVIKETIETLRNKNMS